MRGKEKCKALKEIRKQIAEENDIAYVVSECTHQGECKGTCPKCEAELRYLERELAIRQGLGKAVAVAGISTSVCAGLTACSPEEVVEEFLQNGFWNARSIEEMDGDIAVPADDGNWEGGIEETDEDIAGGLAEETIELEILEGDIAVIATPLPESLEEVSEEVLMGEIYIPEEEEQQ